MSKLSVSFTPEFLADGTDLESEYGSLVKPLGVAIDATLNVYIADAGSNTIREVVGTSKDVIMTMWC